MATVLIVDDEAHIREVVRFALEKAGFRVVEAANGRAALEAFEEHRPDLLVLDTLMPEMDGTDVCREIRRRSSVPIVFLSSKDDEVDRIVGLKLGGDDYLTKPVSRRADGRVARGPAACPAALDPQGRSASVGLLRARYSAANLS